MYEWARNDENLLRVGIAAPGIGEGTSFQVTARRFIYVSEADVASMVYCSSPYFLSRATGKEGLPTKSNMFAFRPDPNPPVYVLPCKPAHLGFVTPIDAEGLTDTPYRQATLNLVGPKDGHGSFTGKWRRVSCACSCCLYGDGSRCTSRGGYGPVAWVPYTVTRTPQPPASRNDAFLAQMVDGLLAGSSDRLGEFAEELGRFIRERLHRFRSAKAAAAWVNTRAFSNKRGNWVERWIANQPSAVDDDDHAKKAAIAIVSSRARAIGWKLPNHEVGRPHSWESYFEFARSAN